MKTRYKILLTFIFVEVGLGAILSMLRISTPNLPGNSLWLSVGIAPLEILWFLVWRDKDLKPWIRITSCVLFWHFGVCYLVILISSFANM